MEEFLNLQSIETLIFIFFIYSFAGWFFESIIGIFVVKKFVNRGFLIGPYCPVYGTGVVFITVLLNNYKSDFIVFFILSTLICGFVEYNTSYFMEKWFNARWWDYSNKKFNINGRVCLGNLFMFGVAASVIIFVFNPFIYSVIEMIPLNVRDILAVVLSLLFIFDFIFSFKIIVDFKDEIDKHERDNTEEVSNMVKEKAENMIMQAETNAIVLSRDLKLVGIKVQRKVKYTGKKYTSSGIKLLNSLTNKAIEGKNAITKRIRLERDHLVIILNDRKDFINNQIDEKKKKSLEFIELNKQNIYSMTNTIRERFKIKSALNKRLMDAFPKMQISFKRQRSNEEKNKSEESREVNK